MKDRVILVEIFFLVWKRISFCVRWMWKWIPLWEVTTDYWGYEWLCFEISGKK